MKSFGLILFIVFALTSCKMPGGTSPVQYSKERAGQIYNLHQNCNASNTDQDKCETCDKNQQHIATGSGTSAQLTTLVNTVGNMSCKKKCPLCADKLFPDKTEYQKKRNYISRGNAEGICRGHAITTQKFNMLGNFCKTDEEEDLYCNRQDEENDAQCQLARDRAAKCDPTVDPQYKSECKNNFSSKTCVAYYKQIIDDIHNMKFRAIPGFSNLAEFSAHPRFSGSFSAKIKSFPSRFTARGANLTEGSDSGSGSGAGNATVFKEVLSRVKKYNETPYLGLEGGVGDHAVTGYDVQEVPGESGEVLCIRDPNLYSTLRNKGGVQECQLSYMKIENGKIIYMKNGRRKSITRFKLYDEEDGRNVDYAEQQQKVCNRFKAKMGLCSNDSEEAKPI